MKNFLLAFVTICFCWFGIDTFYTFIDYRTTFLYPYGDELLEAKNDIWVFIITMAMLHLLMLFISYVLYSKRVLKGVLYGVLITVFVSLIINSLIVFDNIDKGPRVVQFDYAIWNENQIKPIKMIRSINGWSCFSKQEALSILGKPVKTLKLKEGQSQVSFDANSLYYITDISWEGHPYYLALDFNIDSICVSKHLYIMDYID